MRPEKQSSNGQKSDNLRENTGNREGTKRVTTLAARDIEALVSDASPEERQSLSELLPSMYKDLYVIDGLQARLW